MSADLTDDGEGSSRPYLQYLDHAVQLQFAGFLLVVFPKRGVTHVLTYVGLVVFVGAVLATALLVLVDAVHAHSTEAEYRPRRILWPIVAVALPIVGGYVYRRRRRRRRP